MSFFSTMTDHNPAFYLYSGIPDKDSPVMEDEFLLQAEIQRLAEFNRSIVASAPVGIATINHAGQATSANDALIKITGSPSLEETLKLNIHIPAIQKVNFEAIFAEILTSGETLTVSKLPYVTSWETPQRRTYSVQPLRGLRKE